jgi:predicted double-glycine peptidase
MKQDPLRNSILLLIALFATSTFSFASESVAKRQLISGIPYIAQRANYCGPAALTSVFRYWGLGAGQEMVGRAVFDPKLRGTHGAEMLLYARRKGFSAYSWNSNINDLKSKLAQGIPVIVLQERTSKDKSGHYRVAIGYDDTAGVIRFHDPYDKKNKSAPYSQFQARWQRYGNWALLICHPSRDTFVQELGQKNPVVHIDLAYAHFKQGNIQLSERESRKALALYPTSLRAQILLDKALNAAVPKIASRNTE